MAQQLKNSRFLKAMRGETTDKTPVWLMRQAGRYMEIYRKLRAKHKLLELVKTPQLACEVTLQPIDAFDLDAAIIFSDILPLLEGLGLGLEFVQGEGPHIPNPIRSSGQIYQLPKVGAQECMNFTLEAIKLTVPELAKKNIPLIGFSGAPFTLASYAIEGGSSKTYLRTKQLMYTDKPAWDSLMSTLAALVSDYLIEQHKAGVSVVQLFDSWAGALSPSDYRHFVLPHNKKIVESVKKAGVPILYFSQGTTSYLPLISELDCDGFSVDWRIPVNQAWSSLGINKVLQGNLDPLLLLGSQDELKRQVERTLSEARKVKPDLNGYIFNLGHGVLKETPEDNVRRLVDMVHEDSARGR
jgi:uroporphyrinogen decarboxylase